MELNYQFYEDCFVTYTPVSDSRIDYSVIEQVIEDQDHYFLFISANTAHILRKDSFTQGDPMEFYAFITEKCGKEIKYIN